MKIVQLRKKLGMTQAELAIRCRTTQQTIAKIEKNVVDPQISTLRKIAEALECELPDLFFTRHEFISQINEIAKNHKLNIKKIGILGLNTICATENHIPPYHPFWEEVIVLNNRAQLKEKAK